MVGQDCTTEEPEVNKYSAKRPRIKYGDQMKEAFLIKGFKPNIDLQNKFKLFQDPFEGWKEGNLPTCSLVRLDPFKALTVSQSFSVGSIRIK